ncbi:YciI family protein [Albimonas sp. CAU 1670]|uniref:YciI family protein n=1 Tax=Albimonas sp. CAU 1670 TaxID=3032599 RepID=UPI0023DCBE25|nr:YciI family protein [Albimonas sp. CAU 1670]MDF2231574.1 YciI family protein [Albimonas sp. CAU 1670]
MQYLLMIHSDEIAYAAQPPAALAASRAAYMAYTEALRGAGALVAGERLQPTATAATVRVGEAGTQVLDGPYAEMKEQFGGYYLIEAPDLDAAIAWAAKCPGASHGAIEVRPLFPMAA